MGLEEQLELPVTPVETRDLICPKKVKVAIVPSGGSSCLDISNVRDEAGGAYPTLVPSLLESLALLRERDAVHGGTTVQGHTGATRMD